MRMVKAVYQFGDPEGPENFLHEMAQRGFYCRRSEGSHRRYFIYDQSDPSRQLAHMRIGRLEKKQELVVEDDKVAGVIGEYTDSKKIKMRISMAVYRLADAGELDMLLKNVRQKGFDVRPYRRTKHEIYMGENFVGYTKGRNENLQLLINGNEGLLRVVEEYRRG